MNSLPCILVAMALPFGLAAPASAEALPKDFRAWTHTKSMVITDKTSGLYGFHHVYANDSALKTLKSGGTYANEATFVVSFFEVVSGSGTVSAGAKLMDVTMRKDAKGAAATGGWQYAAFDPQGKAKAIDAAKDCHVCHQSQAAKDFVYSGYTD